MRAFIGDMIEIVAKIKDKRDPEAGDAKVQFNLGLCYETVTGIAIDKYEAFKCFKLAAVSGNAVTQAKMGNREWLRRVPAVI